MTGALTIEPPTGAAQISLKAEQAAQQALITCYQTDVPKWVFGKQTDDSWILYDATAPAQAIIVAPAGGTQMSFTRSSVFAKASGYDEAAVAYSVGGITTWDVFSAPMATVAIGAGNTTMGAPSNVIAGRVYTVRFVQTTPPRTVAWNVNFKWVGGTSGIPTISTANGAVDRFTFIGRAGGIMEEIGRAQGIA